MNMPDDPTYLRPRHLDLKKDQALTVQWANGDTSVYPVAYLRRMSPSAEVRDFREKLAKNPLTVLPGNSFASRGSADGPLRAEKLELVGNYAVRVIFSDGHHTGLYSWQYLRDIDPEKSLATDEHR